MTVDISKWGFAIPPKNRLPYYSSRFRGTENESVRRRTHQRVGTQLTWGIYVRHAILGWHELGLHFPRRGDSLRFDRRRIAAPTYGKGLGIAGNAPSKKLVGNLANQAGQTPLVLIHPHFIQ